MFLLKAFMRKIILSEREKELIILKNFAYKMGEYETWQISTLHLPPPHIFEMTDNTLISTKTILLKK